MSLLESVDGPDDLKRLDAAQLPQLAGEIRDFLVTAVAKTGGHLGPNLGAVELTTAVGEAADETVGQDERHHARNDEQCHE